ncbi:hypothetical protein, partial [Oceanicella sp. SM1341]|uniref:hypothetical protein n=1 Tax=Oceanicella sp. SM1341 TaxID=1548889 RepID=UPI0018E5944B
MQQGGLQNARDDVRLPACRPGQLPGPSSRLPRLSGMTPPVLLALRASDLAALGEGAALPVEGFSGVLFDEAALPGQAERVTRLRAGGILPWMRLRAPRPPAPATPSAEPALAGAPLDPRNLPPLPPGLLSPAADARDAVDSGLAERLEAAAAAGVAGVVIDAPQRLPAEAAAALFAALRARHPGLCVVANSAGLPQAVAEALAAQGYDMLASSLGWWDYRARWLPQETLSRRPSRPPMALLTDAPPATAPARLARRVRAAAALCGGLALPLAEARR